MGCTASTGTNGRRNSSTLSTFVRLVGQKKQYQMDYHDTKDDLCSYYGSKLEAENDLGVGAHCHQPNQTTPEESYAAKRAVSSLQSYAAKSEDCSTKVTHSQTDIPINRDVTSNEGLKHKVEGTLAKNETKTRALALSIKRAETVCPAAKEVYDSDDDFATVGYTTDDAAAEYR